LAILWQPLSVVNGKKTFKRRKYLYILLISKNYKHAGHLQWGTVATWIFIKNIDEVEGGYGIFRSCVFALALEIFLPTLLTLKGH